VTKEFCMDHYWYGPNKCDNGYCRVTEEKYLQWQCKKTCNLCNTDPSAKEMDEICDAYLGPEIRAKYLKNSKPAKTNPTKPPRKTPNKTTSRPETKRPGKPTTKRPEKPKTKRPEKPTTRRPGKPKKNKSSPSKGKFKPASKNILNKKGGKNRNKAKTNSKKSGRKESPRSSGGFVVLTDPKRRAQLRSFWTRKG